MEGLLITGGVMLASWLAVCGISAFGSGWTRWASVYRCSDRPTEGDFLASHSLALRPPALFGHFPYALRVGASALGLHLRTNYTLPFFHTRLRVPWDDVRVTEKKWLFLRCFVLEFSGAEGPRLILRPGAFALLRRKSRLYWDPAEGSLIGRTAAPVASAFDGPASPTDEVESPWATGNSPLRLPDHGGVIGPAPVDPDGALSMSGLPGRLVAGAAVALVVVATLNVIGIFGGVAPGADAEQAELIAQIEAMQAELEGDGAMLEGGGHDVFGSAPGLAESDDACPHDAFPTGDRFPAGREIYCIHAQEAVRHGPFVAWHDNGALKAEGRYELGLRQGRWVKYDTNGNLRAEAEFADDRMHGVSRTWSSDGTLKAEAHWQHGTRI